MDVKFPFPENPEKWQAAYTADNAYYDTGSVSPAASFIGLAATVLALVYALVTLFNVLPMKQVLYLDPEFISNLNEPNLTSQIRQAFQNQKRTLSPLALIAVEQSGSKWMIIDGSTRYYIRNEPQNEQPNLKVYVNQNPLITLIEMLILVILAYFAFKRVRKIAIHRAGKFLQEFYLPPEEVDAVDIIKYRIGRRIKLPMPFSEWFPSIAQFKYILVQNGEIRNPNGWPAWMACNIGGPILLIVFDGSALYIERGNRFSRVVGPGISFLERYEKIKYALDLRPKSKTDSVSVWTKDGIFIKLTVCIEYRIGDPQNTKPHLLHPCDPVAVKKAIERYSLRWPDPTKEPGEFTWEDAVWGQVTGIIPDYIGSRFLDDLLVADRNGGQILAPEATSKIFESLNGATRGFGVYVTDFQIVSVELPPEVEQCYVEYWEAERQSRTVIMDGKAKAFDIRAREKIRAKAQHDLILAIADGLRKNESGQMNEALLLSLSEVLDHGLNDPYVRSLTANETLETLEKIKDMF
jgi:regulator of protease activity HflC (stomatin/prohibitin superfamily)